MDNHEPMTLGSPVSHVSPTSHTTPFQQHAGGQYLPGYLMGDPGVGKKSPVLNRSLNATGQSHSLLISPALGTPGATTSPTCTSMSPGSKFSQMIRSRVNASSMQSKDKVGAPPVSSLTDDDTRSSPFHPGSCNRSGVIDVPVKANSSLRSENHTPRLNRSSIPPRSLVSSMDPNSPAIRTPPSPAQIDPFYTQGEALTSQNKLDDTWVTVFGFPPTANSYILQQFSKCGVILEHCSAPDEGNWINIRFESKLQARKALSKSGKIFPGNLMIGVAPCIDLTVVNRNVCDPVSRLQQESSQTLSSPIVDTRKFDSSVSSVNSPKPCTIRPLTAAYNAASGSNKVTSDVRTPQKSSGVLTKAMDYIFG